MDARHPGIDAHVEPAARRGDEPAVEALAERFLAGDQAAFAPLAERWLPELVSLAWRLTGDRAEAEDVAQIVLVAAAGARGRFAGRSRFSTWLYRVAVNQSLDRRRAAERRRRALAELGARADGAAPPSPESASLARETAREVAAAVLALPARERAVVVLRHYHDLPLTRVAEVLDAPVTTVKSRLQRGLERLRTRLQEHAL